MLKKIRNRNNLIAVPKEQSFFYTSDWQKEEKKANRDIEKGRVSKTKNLKELFEKLNH